MLQRPVLPIDSSSYCILNTQNTISLKKRKIKYKKQKKSNFVWLPRNAAKEMEMK